MMKILNFGSLNIDTVFSVEHIVLNGETISAAAVQKNVGGKGLNQSVALARAGAKVFHAGNVGTDGQLLTDFLKENKVDTSFVRVCKEPSGAAFIQVDANGSNSIVVCGAANAENDEKFVDEVLSHFGEGDVVLLQNEISSVGYIMKRAAERQMKIVFNPSPSDGTQKYDLSLVDIFILNEHECAAICGEKEIDKMPAVMLNRFPKAKTVLTLGEKGAVFFDSDTRETVEAVRVTAVDTTAAGDTFTGFFLKKYLTDGNAASALQTAARAASVAVTRKGAAVSIPYANELS